jgi:hypothetical protein
LEKSEHIPTVELDIIKMIDNELNLCERTVINILNCVHENIDGRGDSFLPTDDKVDTVGGYVLKVSKEGDRKLQVLDLEKTVIARECVETVGSATRSYDYGKNDGYNSGKSQGDIVLGKYSGKYDALTVDNSDTDSYSSVGENVEAFENVVGKEVYAVSRGHQTGITGNRREFLAWTKGYPESRSKKFRSNRKAKEWLRAEKLVYVVMRDGDQEFIRVRRMLKLRLKILWTLGWRSLIL